MHQTDQLGELTAFAHRLADASGRSILPHFRRPLHIDNKAAGAGYDPVTAADREAERTIADLIVATYPDHGIVGEEFGSIQPGASLQWVIDPIDGTRAFVLGMPVWGTLIGLTEDGKPQLGLMDQPYTRERFWASGGTSMFRDPNGRQHTLATRPCASLDNAMMTTTHPDFFAAGAEHRAFQAIKDAVRTCRYGGDCYAYCMLAAGHVDLIVETGLKPYDVAALIPIVQNAGGIMTTWDNGPAGSGGAIVAAGDPRIHEHALRILNP